MQHLAALLKAELAATKKQSKAAVESFEQAILMAGRQGISHDQALANERLGDYYGSLNRMSDAEYHLQEAVKLYSEWGAVAKCEILRAKHGKLLAPPSQIGALG